MRLSSLTLNWDNQWSIFRLWIYTTTNLHEQDCYNCFMNTQTSALHENDNLCPKHLIGGSKFWLYKCQFQIICDQSEDYSAWPGETGPESWSWGMVLLCAILWLRDKTYFRIWLSLSCAPWFPGYNWRFIYLQRGTQSLVTRVHMTKLTRSDFFVLQK